MSLVFQVTMFVHRYTLVMPYAKGCAGGRFAAPRRSHVFSSNDVSSKLEAAANCYGCNFNRHTGGHDEARRTAKRVKASVCIRKTAENPNVRRHPPVCSLKV